MSKKSLSLDIETLVELTPEDQKHVNGGYASLSSALKPTATAVSSAKPPAPTPPVHKHKHPKHQTVSSVMPTPPVHI